MTRRSKIVAMTAVLCAVIATPSFARHQNHKNNSIVIDKNANSIGEGYYAPQRAPCCNPGPGKYRKASRGQPAALTGSARNAVSAGDRRAAAPNLFAAYAALPKGNVTLAGVVEPLASKAREIVSACGSKIVSAVSRRGNRSNHPLGRAVDIQGNPSCIYARLHGWPGGVSTDYNSAPGGKHVHISYNPGGQEWGLRFAHSGKARVRHAAKRKHHRYAKAG